MTALKPHARMNSYTPHIFLTWYVLLPHLSPQRGIVALPFLLVRTRRLMHTQEGERQSHSCVSLQHIGTVVADGVHGQRTRRLVHRLCEGDRVKSQFDVTQTSWDIFKGKLGFPPFFILPSFSKYQLLSFSSSFSTLLSLAV